MLRTHRSLKDYCATLWWRWLVFFVFPCNGALVEWNWQGRTEVLWKKKTCPSATLSTTNPTRTRASAVRGRRLTAWTMARPLFFHLFKLLLLVLDLSLFRFCSHHPSFFIKLLPIFCSSPSSFRPVFPFLHTFDMCRHVLAYQCCGTRLN
jgi:hypothetical protein